MKKNNKIVEKKRIDDRHTFKELVDLEQLERVFTLFSEATGFAVGLVTHPEEELLVHAGWRAVCTAFHRAHPLSVKKCEASDLALTGGLGEPGEINIGHCQNNMVNGSTPVFLQDEHVANLFAGQVFLKKPNKERFKEQGEEYGYDVETYLDALENVSVTSEEKLANALKFLGEMTVVLVEESLRNLENNATIQRAEKSEKRYRDLFDSVPVGIYRSTPDGRFLDGNFALLGILGYPNNEIMLSANIQNLYLEIEDRKKELSFIEEKGEVVDYIMQLKRYDEEEIWVKDSSKAVRDGKGKTLHFYGRLEDITEQVDAEKALRKSEANLRAFMDNASGFGVYSTRVEHGEGQVVSFTFASPSLDEIMGIDNLTTEPDLFQYIHKDDLERVEKANKISRERGKAFNQVFRAYHPRKKEWRWFHIISSAVINDNGSYRYFNGLVLDITKQKGVEIALKEEEAKYRSLIEQSNDVIYLLYEDSFEMVNPKFEEVFGIRAEEACSLDFDFMTLVAPESQALIRDRSQKVLLGENTPLRYEFTALRKDGVEIEMDVAVSYIAYKDGIATQGILRDITKRKEAEKALKKSNAQLKNSLKEIEELQAELRYQAIRDPLTGLFNRRYLEEAFNNTFANYG
ncbi:MAG: PAS domain S-box protein, partial [Anaerolineae bacterium]|nr:PAS domain S-box protein [Anaerolineae bacterium]